MIKQFPSGDDELNDKFTKADIIIKQKQGEVCGVNAFKVIAGKALTEGFEYGSFLKGVLEIAANSMGSYLRDSGIDKDTFNNEHFPALVKFFGHHLNKGYNDEATTDKTNS